MGNILTVKFLLFQLFCFLGTTNFLCSNWKLLSKQFHSTFSPTHQAVTGKGFGSNRYVEASARKWWAKLLFCLCLVTADELFQTAKNRLGFFNWLVGRQDSPASVNGIGGFFANSFSILEIYS